MEKDGFKLKKKKLLLIAVLLVLAVLAIQVLRHREPEYQNRPLTYWLAKLDDEMDRPGPYNNPEFRTALAIRVIGTNGIPTMLKLLTAKDFPGSLELQRFSQRLGWKRFNIVNAQTKHRRAAQGFYALGERAKVAESALVEIVRNGRDENSRLMAIGCLLSIKTDNEVIVPILIQLTNNPSLEIGGFAKAVLSRVHPEMKTPK